MQLGACVSSTVLFCEEWLSVFILSGLASVNEVMKLYVTKTTPSIAGGMNLLDSRRRISL
jgi:hypothetical protein